MQNDDAEFVARLKSMTNLEVNWNRESERHALALIEWYRKALDSLRDTVYHTCASERKCRGCEAVSIIDAALAPDPPSPAV